MPIESIKIKDAVTADEVFLFRQQGHNEAPAIAVDRTKDGRFYIYCLTKYGKQQGDMFRCKTLPDALIKAAECMNEIASAGKWIVEGH